MSMLSNKSTSQIVHTKNKRETQYNVQNKNNQTESTLREYKSPRKRFCRQHLATLATPTICGTLVPNFPTELFCKQLPVFVNNCRFTEFLNVTSTSSNDHNKTRTWSSLSPQETSHKIWCKSLHNFFSYRGHRQTDRHTQTNAGENIFPRFHGDHYSADNFTLTFETTGPYIGILIIYVTRLKHNIST